MRSYAQIFYYLAERYRFTRREQGLLLGCFTDPKEMRKLHHEMRIPCRFDCFSRVQALTGIHNRLREVFKDSRKLKWNYFFRTRFLLLPEGQRPDHYLFKHTPINIDRLIRLRIIMEQASNEDIERAVYYEGPKKKIPWTYSNYTREEFEAYQEQLRQNGILKQ